MPRPRRDGLPSSQPNKKKLTELFLRKLQPQRARYLVHDLHQRGLAVQVEPTGHKAWKYIYSVKGRPHWLTFGRADAIGLAEARALAAEATSKVMRGESPRASGGRIAPTLTFGEVAARYVEEHAKKRNRSWPQAEGLVRRNLLPRWGELPIAAISRQDAKTAFRAIKSPTVANQTFAAVSAIFSWAVREDIVSTNPCEKIEHHPTKSRDRVLSDAEVTAFWQAFDLLDVPVASALKTILLTGQRPGEVIHMRREHIVGGWWELPGDPDEHLNWPGTKNGQSHRVWVPHFLIRFLLSLSILFFFLFCFSTKSVHCWPNFQTKCSPSKLWTWPMP